MNHNTEHNFNKEEDSNELTSSLIKVIGVFNYRGLLVEKTKEGLIWNNKKFQSLEELQTYLEYKPIISTQ
jgi:hypothetical protein